MPVLDFFLMLGIPGCLDTQCVMVSGSLKSRCLFCMTGLSVAHPDTGEMGNFTHNNDQFAPREKCANIVGFHPPQSSSENK